MKAISLILVALALVFVAAPAMAQNQLFTLPKYETGKVGDTDILGSAYTASATHYSAWFNANQFDSIDVYLTSNDSIGIDQIAIIGKASLGDSFQADTSAAVTGHLNSAVNAGKQFKSTLGGYQYPGVLKPYMQLQYKFGADSIGTSTPTYKVMIKGYSTRAGLVK